LKQTRLWPAYAALTLTMVLWGSNPAISRAVMDSVPPVALGWGRWLVVTLVLLPFAWSERAAIAVALRTHARILMVFALIATAPQSIVLYQGLKYSTAVNVGLFNSAIPIFILMLGAMFFGKRVRVTEAAGIAVSLAGVLVILFQGSIDRLLSLAFVPGDLVIFAAMMMWSWYTLRVLDRPRTLSPFALVAVISALGLIASLPLLVAEIFWLGPARLTPANLATIAYIGLGPTLGAMLLYNYGVERVGAVRAGALVHLTPVFASVFAVLLLDEPVRLFHYAGFALVAGGALLALYGPARLLSSRPADS